ncbi:hypothetical protein D9M68_793060 [compost metagenome]
MARLPNTMWIAPPSTVTDFTTLLTIFSGAGSPALALSSGMVLVAAQAAATGSLAIFASGMASTMFSRMYLLARLGAAISARMAMMATTTINSISVKPWRRVFEVFTGERAIKRRVGMVGFCGIRLRYPPATRSRNTVFNTLP